MATITRKVCDLCQQDGELADAQSTQIGLGGLNHEADLCSNHKSKLMSALEPFLRVVRLKEEVKTRKAYPPRQRIPCPNCGVSFTAQGLANHTPTCTGSHASLVEYYCDVPDCGMHFPRAQSLGSHRFRRHGVRKEEVLSCRQCPQSFTAEERLSAHIEKEHSMNAVVSK